MPTGVCIGVPLYAAAYGHSRALPLWRAPVGSTAATSSLDPCGRTVADLRCAADEHGACVRQHGCVVAACVDLNPHVRNDRASGGVHRRALAHSQEGQRAMRSAEGLVCLSPYLHDLEACRQRHNLRHLRNSAAQRHLHAEACSPRRIAPNRLKAVCPCTRLRAHTSKRTRNQACRHAAEATELRANPNEAETVGFA